MHVSIRPCGLKDKVFVLETKDCWYDFCQGHCQSFAEKEIENEKETEKEKEIVKAKGKDNT